MTITKNVSQSSFEELKTLNDKLFDYSVKATPMQFRTDEALLTFRFEGKTINKMQFLTKVELTQTAPKLERAGIDNLFLSSVFIVTHGTTFEDDQFYTASFKIKSRQLTIFN